MVNSMTGYGKAEIELEGGKLTVEIKSLNGKNADISIKSALLPKNKELIIRQRIAQKLQRGNIDFFMTFEANAADSAKEINADLALAYYRQIHDISEKISKEYPDTPSASVDAVLPTILRFQDVLDNGKKQDVVNEENWDRVSACIDEALEKICAYRAAEGESLHKDIAAKVASILGYIPDIEALEKERTDGVRERIESKLNELAIAVDRDRFEQEMIFYIEKLDINEEKVRLRQHCKYFMETMENEPYPGKKLGFIAQEMGREINTTGSKANHSGIQMIVVKMKDELEKIKEQTLNVL